ncbi:MAG: Eco57I restriction-modification methylase [Methanosaeta sp. PtaU1.Bin060]|nr:MAG: Eco57I restriction-modification methylase [Methanosaeta sp. PtaU1.Bin060]
MDDRLKKTLRAISLETRHILEGQNGEAGDLEQQLNRLGIWLDRSKPVVEMPHLSDVDRDAREVMDAYLDFRQQANVARKDAVAEFIRESAYTWANRLFALRIMEARGIIDEVIRKKEVYGGRSLVHNRFAKKNPQACQGEDDGLFTVLFYEFQQRSKDLPDLFNPDVPATKLRPSLAVLKRIIALLSGLEKPKGQEVATDEIFEAPDSFGWAYQYWNEDEKEKTFERAKIEKTKIEGPSIIAATQLYTEPYMVKFLVQNSLGAIWIGMHSDSKLFERWDYYVIDADRATVQIKPVSKISFMDPACGSGHFHLEAFDLFYEMYQEEGILRDPKEICTSILNNNLFGIDIDERAVQIAKAALWMKAIEIAPDLDGSNLKNFHNNFIATNIKLPRKENHIEAFLKNHPDDEPLRPAIEAVFNGLANVGELGSLVQIEDPVDRALLSLKGSLLLFGSESGWDVWKRKVIARLREHFEAESYATDAYRSFFGHSAGQGFALFDLLTHRYDVIATNPPYLGSRKMGVSLKSYLIKHYPSGKRDLFGAFIKLSNNLASPNGYFAMITLQGWLALSSYSELRKLLLSTDSLTVLAHLGRHAFSEADPPGNPVMVVWQKARAEDSHICECYRLTASRPSKEQAKILLGGVSNIIPNIKYIIKQSEMLGLENTPIIYWIHSDIFNLLRSKITVDSEAGGVKQGLATGDNARFLRFFWEVPCNQRWAKYQKGGGYAKWAGLSIYRLDWTGKGVYYEHNERARFQNSDTYFCEGITYTFLARGSLGLRIIENSVYDVHSMSIFPTSDQISRYALMGILNCRIGSYMARVISQDIRFNTGYISRLPLPKVDDIDLITALSIFCHKCKSLLMNQNMIEDIYDVNLYNAKTTAKTSLYNFIAQFYDRNFSICSCLHTAESILESSVFKSYGISNEAINSIIDETGAPAGWLPLIANLDELPQCSIVCEELSSMFSRDLQKHRPQQLSQAELKKLRENLRIFYEAGPGTKLEEDDINNDKNLQEEDGESEIIGASIPLPAETFLEELSLKMRYHPLSIYYLLSDGLKSENWRCVSEDRRITEDLLNCIILRLLGHQWPKQIEAGEPLPDWADKDGIIPLTEGCGERTLLERIHERITEEFPGTKRQDIEREFEDIMEISLEDWLTGHFFKHHISQFKKHPIAWQIESRPSEGNSRRRGRGRGVRQAPVFSFMIYYHKLNVDLLHKIRTHYIRNLRDHFETELRTLEGLDAPTGKQLERTSDLKRWIEELKDFDSRINDVSQNGFDYEKLREIIEQEPLDKWNSRDGRMVPPSTKEEVYLQEKRYDPNINDGVRVNIAPLQKAGLLAVDVLAKKDLDKAISDRAEWRADERRWCRNGKLPRPGWWKTEG